MTEKEAIDELLGMSKQELDLVPYDSYKWVCACKGCKRFTRIRDYGILPKMYSPRIVTEKWFNSNNTAFLCAKHWKLYNRLLKNYPERKIQDKLYDYNKLLIEKIEATK